MLYQKLSVKELQGILKRERAFQVANQDSNTGKKLTAIAVASQMLDSIDDNAMLCNIESVKNTGKHIRDFDMVNLGTLVECIVKQVASGKLLVKKSRGKGADLKLDGKMYEVKACLSATCKNTPMSKRSKVLLVNQLGVWELSADEAQAKADKFGRFSPKAEYDNLRTDLTEMLGW